MCEGGRPSPAPFPGVHPSFWVGGVRGRGLPRLSFQNCAQHEPSTGPAAEACKVRAPSRAGGTFHTVSVCPASTEGLFFWGSEALLACRLSPLGDGVPDPGPGALALRYLARTD